MSKSLSLILIYDWECPISNYSFFDVGSKKPYFPESEKEWFADWFKTGVNKELNDIINAEKDVAIYFSGTFLEQLSNYDHEWIDKIKSAKHIQLLGGTYHHSLASLYSKKHFEREVIWHQKLIKKLFSKKSDCFLNTGNAYFNDLADQLNIMGYNSTFTGAIDWYLGENNNQRVFHSRTNSDFKLLLVNEDQGQTLFHEPEVENHFFQLTPHSINKLGGWKELLRKIGNKAKVNSIKDQIKNIQTSPYNIRQPIGCSYDHISLDQLINYPLQESWLKQLYELEKSISKKSEYLQKEWSRLGSTSILKLLNPELEHNETADSYHSYQSLINILSDLHLKL